MTIALKGYQEVMDVIPQRPPFLFVDTVNENEPGETTTASYLVDPQNPNFAGHFPGNPIFPGVLIIEHMAQVACYCLGSEICDPDCEYLLVRVNNCSFKDKVVPGDNLITTVNLERKFDGFAIFQCQSSKTGNVVANAEILVAFKVP